MEKAVKRYAPIFVLPTFLAFVIGFILPFHRRTVSVLLSVHYRKGRKLYRNRQFPADLYRHYISAFL